MKTKIRLTSRLNIESFKAVCKKRAVIAVILIGAAGVLLTGIWQITVSGQETPGARVFEVVPPTDFPLPDEKSAVEENLDIAYLSAKKDSRLDEKFDRLIAKADAEGGVSVIAGFQFDFTLESDLTASRSAEQRAEIKHRQNAVLNKIENFKPENVKQFETIPYFAATVGAAALRRLKSLPEITSISEDEPVEPTLAESVPLITAPTAWSAGYTGAGWMIAVLDTGVDKNHPFLTDKVISEACYSTTTAGFWSLCPGFAAQSTANNSGLNCRAGIDGCDHGTHVAGIAAGRGTNFSGVARDAFIISIQVFSQISSNCTARCVRSFRSDQIRGLERVMTLRSTYPTIAAVNMSLGAGSYTSTCDTEDAALTTAITNLRSVGIATVVASGNDGFRNAISFPACISTAVRVGSTDDGSGGTTLNGVSDFSNNASFLDLLAPGNSINSSVPGGGFEDKPGTSMAAPHVAGAWALLKHRVPSAPVNNVLNALVSTGLQVADARSGSSGIVKPRIRIDAALQSLSAGTCQPTSIAAGQTVAGSLAANDCYYNGTNRRYADFYGFSGGAGERVAISMNSGDFDAYLYLVDANNQIVAAADDGGPGANSRIPADSGYLTLPAAGFYEIQATSDGDNRVGNYSLNLTSGGVCNYWLSSASQNFSVFGGNGSFYVFSNQNDCQRTATSNNSWITVTSGATGAGAGYIDFSVAPNNSTAARTGTISVAGQTFTVTQPANCVTALSPPSVSVGNNSFNSSISVAATGGCSWTATPNVSWISIVGQGNGTGGGSFGYYVAANASGADRTGTITVLGKIFTVTQSGAFTNCQSSTPIAFGQTVNGALTASDCFIAGQPSRHLDQYRFSAAAGQRISVTMQASSYFSFLYLVNSNRDIIATDGESPSRIPAVSGFFTLPAAGTYSIYATSSAGGTGNYSITLNDEAACGSSSISPSSREFGAAGGSGSINLTINNGCAWTSSRIPGGWLVTAGAGIGSGTVNYTVAANSTGAPRTETIRVDTHSFVVTQSGQQPTAAGVSVGGRVLTADGAAGRGVFGATVRLTGAGGNSQTARTNPFGYYRFANVPAGETHVLDVRHKHYQFAPRAVSVVEDLTEMNFIALQTATRTPPPLAERLMRLETEPAALLSKLFFGL